jgi:hypothetical protein
MKTIGFWIWLLSALPCAMAQATPDASRPTDVAVMRATELRTGKLPSAPAIRRLAVGTRVQVVSIEGGWALVQPSADGVKPAPSASGWLRASALDLRQTKPIASAAAPDRTLAPGARALPPRINRHALIIGIGRYADANIPDLPGVRFDRESATQMAMTMQVPQDNIRYLQNEQATGDGIRLALRALTDRVQEGDRVFIHYSGHGTRFNDPAAGGCVEALLAYDGGPRGTITNHEMADLLKTITNRTDKLFVMYDACHSGGLVTSALATRTRGIRNDNDEGLMRPKFASLTEECGRPVNVKNRNLLVEASIAGALPQDIIHLSAARDNEVSFDDELKGGLATQFMRDCMLREAVDVDRSGAISIDEIRQCAQEKINQRMVNDPNFKPHHLVLNGNSAFVPAWFGQPAVAPFVALAGPATSAVPAPAAPALTGRQALQQMFDQRDAKRALRVAVTREKLQIGRDALDFSVQSERAGYVYVALAGSDNKALYLLFPNKLDSDNRIDAGQLLALPRAHWRVKAAGPAGTDHVLVMVTDAPRDISTIGGNPAGPFVASLNDAQGRTRLGSTMAVAGDGESCNGTLPRRGGAACSDAYGAAMFSIEESP